MLQQIKSYLRVRHGPFYTSVAIDCGWIRVFTDIQAPKGQHFVVLSETPKSNYISKSNSPSEILTRSTSSSWSETYVYVEE